MQIAELKRVGKGYFFAVVFILNLIFGVVDLQRVGTDLPGGPQK